MFRSALAGLLVALVPQPHPPAVIAPPEEVRVLTVPTRPADAVTGSQFAQRTLGWSGRQRQRAAVAELLQGNVPDFLRVLRAVPVSYTRLDGSRVEGLVWIMPDYLAIGSSEDFLYIPLTLPSATAVANAWGFVLPTSKLVDDIYANADHRLTPEPMKPGPRMRSSAYFLEHQRRIDAQRGEIPPGTLLTGHKKDVVLTNRLAEKAGRIAIYGWHRKDGDPIQPLSIVHGARYADYSHGARMVWNRVWVGGRMRSIFDVLQDPDLAPAFTYEGTIRFPRKLMHADGEPWAE